MPDGPIPAVPLLNLLTIAALIVGVFNPDARRYTDRIATTYQGGSPVRGLSAATLAVAGHCVVTTMVGTLAAILAWVMLEFNRPVVLVATAAGCLLSGIAQLVRAAYGGWSTRRRPTESSASTTASAIYGFVLSPCRPVLMLYFATPLVGSRAFALVSVVFGAAAIGSVMFHAALVLGRHRRRYFFQSEIACRVIVGIFLCLVSVIVLSRFWVPSNN
jgi:hypothetical protein